MSSQVIVLRDDQVPNPEDRAMLCALYSRSSASVLDHLEKVKKSGSGKFMESFYLNYGHSSIADCSTVYLFFERVTMLTAVALEDFPLFNGQECSSRYIDFEQQSDAEPGSIQAEWIKLYAKVRDAMIRHYEQTLEPKAARLAAFDIASGFLPAGVRTNVAFVTTMRQARAHLNKLRHHPLQEVRQVAANALTQLHEHYPNSFEHPSKWSGWDVRHNAELSYGDFYETEVSPRFADELTFGDLLIPHSRRCRVDFLKEVYDYSKDSSRALRARTASMYFEATLDFARWRDLHRHRSIIGMLTPVLDRTQGMAEFYLTKAEQSAELKDIRQVVDALLARAHAESLNGLSLSHADSQLDLPIGLNVHFRMTLPFDKLMYLAQLRSQPTVHPTLRALIMDMVQRTYASIKALHESVCYSMPQHPELNFDASGNKLVYGDGTPLCIFDLHYGQQDYLKRSKQDIVEK